MDNYFTALNEVDCSKHVEKKGGFSYLSWPFAIAELRKRHPNAIWEVCRFNGLPFMQTDAGWFVEVAVTVEGVRLSQIHPVLDNRNKPILKPDAFQINTSIQRALVKAIALHGLGLFIYAGEDLPEMTREEIIEKGPPAPINPDTGAWEAMTNKQKSRLIDLAEVIKEYCHDQDYAGAYEAIDAAGLDTDEKVALKTRLDSKIRTPMAAWRKANPAGQ